MAKTLEDVQASCVDTFEEDGHLRDLHDHQQDFESAKSSDEELFPREEYPD
jgi:hypothetical protein